MNKEKRVNQNSPHELRMAKDVKLALVLGSIFMFLAVALGAFGAHGLEGKISDKALDTWQTGVEYQFYHALALLALAGVHARYAGLKLTWTYRLFFAGTVFFSFNCYLYALAGIKTFAMMVPLGGLSFLAGWLFAIKTFIKDAR